MKTPMRIIGNVIIAVLVLLVSGCKQKKLVCHSPELNVTIKYNNKTLLDYVTDGKNHFSLENLNHIIEEIGIEQLLKDYRLWFENETGGSCR